MKYNPSQNNLWSAHVKKWRNYTNSLGCLSKPLHNHLIFQNKLPESKAAFWLMFSSQYTIPPVWIPAATFCPLWILSPLLYPHKLLWFIVWRRLWKRFLCSHRCNKQWAAENTDSYKWVRLWHDSDLNTCCPVRLCSRVLKLCQLWWIWLSSADDDMIKEATKGERTTLDRMILISFKTWALCHPRSDALKGDILCSSVSFLSYSRSV